MITAEGVMQVQTLAQVFIRSLAPSSWKIDDWECQLATDTGFQAGLGRLFGEEVHVRKTGRPGLDHLGNGQLCAVADELLTHPSFFRGPDVLVEPCLERLVIRVTAQQA